ncbi:MAG: hypothetical protein FJ206_13120 [Gemmatimonadetes bacterium]|nr:hypothetical protein [Gemmatimonadota bacterium]
MIPGRYRALLLVVTAACGSEPISPPPGGVTTFVLQSAGGDGQRGPAATDLPVALSVRLSSGGVPVAGAQVAWTITGGGTGAATSTTDATGLATNSVRLGPPGTIEVTARSDRQSSTTFTLQAVAASGNPVLVGEVAIPPQYGIHDSYVRDGIAFVSAWNTGIIIYDVGDGRAGGSPSKPQEVGRLITSDNGVPGGAAVHNAWWFHNPNGEKRYLFIGQEGPATLFSTSSGDIHVVDVSDLRNPREVAFLKIPGAGAHNFWMDEASQTLYAAYYNGGVVALDVSGTLTGDLTSRIRTRVTPGGPGNTFVWGVQLSGGVLWANDIVSGLWALDPVTLATRAGGNNVPERWGSDLWIHGSYGYTGTWGGTARGGTGYGDAIKIWSLAGGPVLVDSLIVADVRTISDLQVTDDGRWLVVTTERLAGQGIRVYDLANPTKPVLRGFTGVATGLHTGTVAAIGGRTYVFAAKNPAAPALQIYDITP